MRRGEVYRAKLEPRSGSEQRGVRPVLIVSNDIFNETPGWASLIVVPISTSGRQRNRPLMHVPVAVGEGGLERDSVVLCHQITTLDRSKFGERMGTLSDARMQQVEQAMQFCIGIFTL